jgi:orotidine 5'-phosphate decarboxylase subfamily 2
VVGLDPFPDRVDDPEAFCKGIVDAVAPYAVAVKPQSAFFEVRGWKGVRALESVCAYARGAGLLVIADVKRGDIGTTAQAYVDAVRPHADAATVNPYLGGDSLQPFLEACRDGFGIFVLVKTSNPGSGDASRNGGRRRRRSARSSARHIRTSSRRRARSYPTHCYCYPASARRARPSRIARRHSPGLRSCPARGR